MGFGGNDLKGAASPQLVAHRRTLYIHGNDSSRSSGTKMCLGCCNLGDLGNVFLSLPGKESSRCGPTRSKQACSTDGLPGAATIYGLPRVRARHHLVILTDAALHQHPVAQLRPTHLEHWHGPRRMRIPYASPLSFRGLPESSRPACMPWAPYLVQCSGLHATARTRPCRLGWRARW